MKNFIRNFCLVPILAFSSFLAVMPASADDSKEKLVEIFRIAPGQHEAFLKHIALTDEVNRRAGLPARDLYVHSNGNGWDFMIIQPAHTPEDKREALDKAWDEMNMPSGINYFVEIRKFIADHNDTFATGPITAKEYLSGLKNKE